MKSFDLNRFNYKKLQLGENSLQLVRKSYNDLVIVNDRLVDSEGFPIGTKGDMYTKKILDRILQEGCLDHNPRPVYKDFYEGARYNEKYETIVASDGEQIKVCQKDKMNIKENGIELISPAHTLSVNEGVECTYDLSKGETPMITLRPIAVKSSVRETFWIWKIESNDLVEFDELLGKNTWEENHEINNWWKDWALRDDKGLYLLNEKGHPHIGACYGGTTKPRHMLYTEVIEQIRNNPDSRRNIACLWQTDDFKNPHGLKPCAFLIIFNVRHGWDNIDYLDMTLVQRSSDFLTAGCINQVQYVALQKMVARELNLTPGMFTWKPINIQIYDRHIEQSIEMLNREPINAKCTVELREGVQRFEDMKPEDIYIDDYPADLIKAENPQLKLQLGI